jgi:hypothetical protein
LKLVKNIMNQLTKNILKNGARLMITALLLFVTQLYFAQTPSFVAQVSKNKVAVGEVFTVAFTLNGSGNSLQYPAFTGFEIYAGPNQSQSVSMVNGTVSQSITLSLYLYAKQIGKYTIGVATVMSGNQKLETKPIVIEVVKGNPQPQQQQQNNNNNQQPANEKTQFATEMGNDDLFVKTYLSKTKGYIGEQIIATQKVYSRVDLRGFQNMKFPPYNGFWSQTENSNQQINLQTENVNGVNYYVADLNKVYLFPQRSGEITIQPVELDCIVRRQTKRQPRNIFEQFFGTGGYEDVVVKVKSKTVKLNILELPTENKPENFNGAVGDFSYKVSIDKNEVKANDAINLKLTISGSGNIKLIEPLKLKLPESFEVYDPKVNENIKTTGGVSGTKTFDYLIIPREQGTFTLSNIGFSYFDADKKKYVSIPSPDINVKVLEGDGSSAQIISSNKKTVKETENDLRYIKTGNLNLSVINDDFFGSVTHFLLLALPFLLFIAGLFFMQQHIKANSNLTLVKERKAAKLAKKQLSVAEKHLKTNTKDLFFNEVLNALNNYIGDKFRMSVVDFSKEKISDMLLSRNVTTITTQHVIETLNTCEYAKYAPAQVTGDLNKVYNDTLKLISDIEEQIKKA